MLITIRGTQYKITSTKAKKELVKDTFRIKNIGIACIPVLDIGSEYKYIYKDTEYRFRRIRNKRMPIEIMFVFEGRLCMHHIAILNNLVTLVPESWFTKL